MEIVCKEIWLETSLVLPLLKWPRRLRIEGFVVFLKTVGW